MVYCCIASNTEIKLRTYSNYCYVYIADYGYTVKHKTLVDCCPKDLAVKTLADWLYILCPAYQLR